MKHEYLTSLYRKLERRFERIQELPPAALHGGVARLVGFILGNSLLREIADDLLLRNKDSIERAEVIVAEKQPLTLGATDESNSALALAVLIACGKSLNHNIECDIGFAYFSHIDHNVRADAFRVRFLPPVLDYLIEHLSDQRALLALLRRYKHRCEWFRQNALLSLWQSNTATGERALTEDLYEYLHDQGLEFTIEPTSASGKPDLISAQVGEEKLIADAKVFKDGTLKSYLAKGFHQIYQYTLDYNQPFGYLIIFKTCENDLKFPMADQEQSSPFIVHNNKTVFFVVIDICHHETTASKRGILKTIEITEADLIQKAEAGLCVE